MKSTLIKINGIYNLLQNDRMIASDDADFQVDYNIAKLSLKNCESVANGYDLDELARNYVDEQPNDFQYTTDEYWNAQVDFKKGFQKALEILGDKKFSEEDIQSFIDSENPGQYPYIALQLKQKSNEWDVVVEMDIDNPCPKCGEKDNVHGNYDYSNITRPLINTLCNECGTYFSPIPKLDADGCLILKRK